MSGYRNDRSPVRLTGAQSTPARPEWWLPSINFALRFFMTVPMAIAVEYGDRISRYYTYETPIIPLVGLAIGIGASILAERHLEKNVAGFRALKFWQIFGFVAGGVVWMFLILTPYGAYKHQPQHPANPAHHQVRH